jgi:ferredoxin-NADP reductase
MIAVIKNKILVASGTLRVEFDTLDSKFGFIPGQHMVVSLIHPPDTDAEGNSRFFSIVNSPLEKHILIMTTRLRDTAFKRVLYQLPIGAEVQIDQIGGNFILPKNSTMNLGFIAGGIGITPFMSMISYADSQITQNYITLLYSNRDQVSTAYFNNLTEISQRNKNIKVIFIMTKDPLWNGEKRHINPEIITKYFSDITNMIFYIAGPPAMVREIYTSVIESGVMKEHIKTEYFGEYDTKTPKLKMN